MRLPLHLVAGLTLAAAASASADTVQVRFVGTGMGRTTTVSGSVFNGTVYAGVLTHQFSNGTGVGAYLNGNIGTFCTELTEYVKTATNTFNVVNVEEAPSPGPSMTQAKATAIREVWAAANGAQFANASNAQGFQALIWEIVYDFNGSVASIGRSSGNVQLGNLNSAATNFFNSLVAHIGSGVQERGLRAVVHAGAQDQLVVIPIPLPSAAGLAAMGLVAVAAPRRQRRA